MRELEIKETIFDLPIQLEFILQRVKEEVFPTGVIGIGIEFGGFTGLLGWT